MTRLLIDTGDIVEDLEITDLAQTHGSQIWGATTNPSKISKALAGKIVTSSHTAFSIIQKHIVHNILQTVPGAVSAEVYADPTTTPEEMVTQGIELAAWDPRVVVKLPTTLAGFKARTELRKRNIPINNTLVFSQEQVFAIALHERLMMEQYGAPYSQWPCFTSPFIGRLDDQGEDGLSLIKHSISILRSYFNPNYTWLLAASIRNAKHLTDVMEFGIPMVTAPAKVYEEYFGLTETQKENSEGKNLQEIPQWTPSDRLVETASNLLKISSVDEFYDAITNRQLSINHPLTDAGIQKFVSDWNTLLKHA